MAQDSKGFLDKYWRESRQNRYGVYLAVYLTIVVALLGGFNYLADRFNKTYDATTNQRYTLSDQTRKIAAGLKEDVVLRYFDASTGFGAAKELLSRYDELSPRLRVEYVDIDQKPNEARAAGITTRGETVLNRGERFERASLLTEEEVTRALVRLVREGGRKACILQGSGEPDLASQEPTGGSNLAVLLQASDYQVQPVNPLSGQQLDSTCTVAIVPGPRSNYPEAVATALDNFVKQGGGVLLMIDPAGELEGLRTEESTSLISLASRWGVDVKNQWLLGELGSQTARLLGPFTLVVNRYEPHPINSTLGDGLTLFPEARPLAIRPDAAERVTPLISSLPGSYAANDLKVLSQEIDLSKLERGPFLLAAVGSLPGAAPAQPAGAAETPAEASDASKPGRFVVVGTSKWASNGTVGRYENRYLFTNMVNWLASDEDLISIPPKAESDATLVLSPDQLRIVNLTAIFGIPLFVIALGVMVWLRRR